MEENNLTPGRENRGLTSVWQDVKTIILASRINFLLLFIPVSWILHFVLPGPVASRDAIIFIFSFVSIIPLAKLLAYTSSELSPRVGPTLGYFINATLGNTFGFIVSIIALTKCELRMVQLSLVGSILNNLLLAVGLCFFASGLKYAENGLGAKATQLNPSLLTICIFAVLLPVAFYIVSGPQLTSRNEGKDVLVVSHATAIILLFIYVAYLAFQLHSHANLYDERSITTTQYPRPKFFMHSRSKWAWATSRRSGSEMEGEIPTASYSSQVASGGSRLYPSTTLEPILRDGDNPLFIQGSSTSRNSYYIPPRHDVILEVPSSSSPLHGHEEERQKEPTTSFPVIVGLLCVVTVVKAFTATWLFDSINGMTGGGHISKEFVGLILLPLVGNAAVNFITMTDTMANEHNLARSLGVAAGSIIQIALFVLPFIVTLAWILGKPLTLLFDPFESITMFLVVLLVNYTAQDGKSNWLKGFILICLYLMLGMIFWFYPGSDPSGFLETCH